MTDHFRQGAEAWRADRDRRAPKTSSANVIPFADAVGMDDVPLPPMDAYASEVQSSGNSVPKQAFELVRASDMTFADPEYAVDGLLEVDCVGTIFGKPGSGKSFIAIDMACCIATGTPYHGRDVLQGAVVYIAGEGHNGLKRRQMAWEKHNEVRLSNVHRCTFPSALQTSWTLRRLTK